MRTQIAFRSETPAPEQYDTGSGYYTLAHCVGLYIDDRVALLDPELVAISDFSELPTSAHTDIGAGYYALEGAVGLFVKEWVIAPADSDRNYFQADGVGGCSFVPTHRQSAVSIDDWSVDGIGGCWFEALDNPSFRCDGIGGAWFVPTRQGPLQMDGAGGAQFGAVGLGVTGLQMDGAGTCLFAVASIPASVQGTFQCDGVGGMEIITTLSLGFISDDGTPGGSNRRWNYAF